MRKGLEALTQQRLLIVTGKGGTGKTTVAAALGMLAARQDLDTVVIEVGDTSLLPRLLCKDHESLKGDGGRSPVQVAPHLFTLRIVPEVALTEYLELQFKVRRIVRLVVRNQGFRRLLDAAPGWRALITLGKLWHLQSQMDSGRPRWPLLIVDGPATGHGLSFLSVPNVVMETVRIGPLRRHTDWVQELLKDASRTLVLAVTLPEELPVSETLELCERIRELGMTLGPVIANAVEPAPDLTDLEPILANIARLPAPPADSALLTPEVLRRCLDYQLRRNELQRAFLEKLEQEAGPAIIPLPYLTRAIDGPDTLAPLADHLATALADWGESS